MGWPFFVIRIAKVGCNSVIGQQVVLKLWLQDCLKKYIVFVWSQYDGANIEQRTIGYGWHQNQEAKLKIVGGVMYQLD